MHMDSTIHACYVGVILLPVSLFRCSQTKRNNERGKNIKVKAIHKYSGFAGSRYFCGKMPGFKQDCPKTCNTYTLFDGLTYNTRGYFADSVKIQAISKMSARIIC